MKGFWQQEQKGGRRKSLLRSKGSKTWSLMRCEQHRESSDSVTIKLKWKVLEKNGSDILYFKKTSITILMKKVVTPGLFCRSAEKLKLLLK